MRVGLDGSYLQPHWRHTGIGTYTRCLVAALAQSEHAQQLVLVGRGDRPDTLPDNLAWRSVPQLPLGRLSPWLSHQLRLPTLVRELKLDVLHVPGLSFRLSREGVPFRMPCALVVTVHDAIPDLYYGRQGPPLPWRLRLGYRLALMAAKRASAWITVSETSRRDLVAHHAYAPQRVRVVFNGVEIDQAPDAEKVAEVLEQLELPHPYLLYMGSFEPRKNLVGVVAAYRHALAATDLPPLVLVVESESGHKQGVMNAVHRDGKDDRLRFLHSLSVEELAAVVSGASLMLFPSFYEGFGLPPLLAMACGVPVVSSDRGALPEILGEAALLVDPASVAQISQAIRRVLDDPALASGLISAGRERARRYNWRTAASRTWEVYQAAAGKR